MDNNTPPNAVLIGLLKFLLVGKSGALFICIKLVMLRLHARGLEHRALLRAVIDLGAGHGQFAKILNEGGLTVQPIDGQKGIGTLTDGSMRCMGCAFE